MRRVGVLAPAALALVIALVIALGAHAQRFPGKGGAGGKAASVSTAFSGGFMFHQPDTWADGAAPGPGSGTCPQGGSFYVNWTVTPRSQAGTFGVLTPATLTDIRFYTKNPNPATFTCHIFQGGRGYASSAFATTTVATTGPGHYVCHFATPVNLLAAGNVYMYAIWDGVGYTYLSNCSGSMNLPTIGSGFILDGPTFMWGSWADYSTADVHPGGNDSGNVYPITPIITVP